MLRVQIPSGTPSYSMKSRSIEVEVIFCGGSKDGKHVFTTRLLPVFYVPIPYDESDQWKQVGKDKDSLFMRREEYKLECWQIMKMDPYTFITAFYRFDKRS